MNSKEKQNGNKTETDNLPEGYVRCVVCKKTYYVRDDGLARAVHRGPNWRCMEPHCDSDPNKKKDDK